MWFNLIAAFTFLNIYWSSFLRCVTFIFSSNCIIMILLLSIGSYIFSLWAKNCIDWIYDISCLVFFVLKLQAKSWTKFFLTFAANLEDSYDNCRAFKSICCLVIGLPDTTLTLRGRFYNLVWIISHTMFLICLPRSFS